MKKIRSEYVPGVCNIGRAEILARRRLGWLGLAITGGIFILLLLLKASALWALLLFIPAASGATGFLQAALHFCAGFGMKGVFNFSNKVGDTETVEQAVFRRADRAKARKIILYSCLIGAAVTALAALVLGVI